MATKRQIVDNIILLRESRPSDDTTFWREQLGFIVDTVRARLIEEEIEKKKELENQDRYIQTLSCLPLIEVSKDDCICQEFPGCTILRTEFKIPSVIMFITVSTLFGNPIPRTSITNSHWRSFREFRPKRKNYSWFYKDEYIYIVGETLLEYIKVVGIFEDPDAIVEVCNNTPEPCVDNEYPLPGHLVDKLTRIIVYGEFRYYNPERADLHNNANAQKQTGKTE